MPRTRQIAKEIAVIMPIIARRVLSQFFQSVDITQAQLFAVMALYEKAPVRLSDLSARLKISAPTVTGIVDRLENAGYVRRIPDSQDRRAINVDLTPKGLKIARKLTATIEHQWEAILLKLPKNDRENYLNILIKIQKAL